MATTFNYKIAQSFIGELAASFIFGFAVYSATISSTLVDQVATPIIVALAVAFSAIAIIYAFVDITLAYFNPAITFAAILFGKLAVFKGLIYIVMQFLGFMLAAAVVLACYPENSFDMLEIVRPKKILTSTRGNLIATELFLTGILTFIAFQVATNVYKKPKTIDGEESEPDKTILAPLVIGLTLGFLALLGFSSSGGVFNPGLVFSPVLFTGRWLDCWVYWIGEFVGAAVGAAIQVFILKRIY